MKDGLKIKLYSCTIDCVNPKELAAFYAALLDWTEVFSDEDYAAVAAPGTQQGEYPGLLFQRNPDYLPPVWPEEADKQQQMAHLDFAVNDLEEAVQHALACGATVAKAQFSDHWKVMFDPAGHPFCLCLMKDIMESKHFALR